MQTSDPFQSLRINALKAFYKGFTLISAALLNPVYQSCFDFVRGKVLVLPCQAILGAAYLILLDPLLLGC